MKFKMLLVAGLLVSSVVSADTTQWLDSGKTTSIKVELPSGKSEVSITASKPAYDHSNTPVQMTCVFVDDRGAQSPKQEHVGSCFATANLSLPHTISIKISNESKTEVLYTVAVRPGK